MDLTLALIFLLLLAPMFFLLLIIVKLDSPGPFFFIQVRIGRNQKEFKIYKIRTMDIKASVRANDPTKTYITTQKNDPRITKVGLFLRKAHLDELPQLINVVLGQMSFVGVRPDAPSQINDYTNDAWQKRHLFRPGITGLSQINSANANFNFSARQKYDLLYVKSNRKFLLDIYIVYKTFLKLYTVNGN
jgi:undecaprenyl phosphate N,N'-diacetylbacillosamine 1-phosphate transferase